MFIDKNKLRSYDSGYQLVSFIQLDLSSMSMVEISEVHENDLEHLKLFQE